MIESIPQHWGEGIHFLLTPKLGSGLLARAVLLGLSVGMVLLVLLDWVFDFEMITIPFGKYTRAFLLVVFSFYLVQTGVWFNAYRFRFGHVLFYFLAINLIYAVLSGDIVGNLYYSSRITFWILGTIVAYRLGRSGTLSEKVLHWTITATVFLGAAFTIYFMTRPETEAGQNASAYLLLWCLPMLLMVKKSRINNIVLALAVVAILLTVKRGAMIALGLSGIAYGLTYLRLHGNVHTFAKMLGFSMLLMALSAYTLAQNWDTVQNRFADTSGSGRDQMYAMLLEHWIEAEPVNVIFGFGINSVQQYTGLIYGIANGSGAYAHSDWLQMMHDFGLLGIAFLVWLHVSFLALIRTGHKMRHPFTPSLMMGYVILFLVNIYSGHLIGPTAIYFGLLLAYVSSSMSLVPGNLPKRIIRVKS